MIMKKIYQIPEMMAAEMAECILQISDPKIGSRTTSAKNIEIKESAWDDFDEE